MSTPTEQPLKWAILGAGWISGMFVKGLVADPSERGVSGAKHAIHCVVSRDKAKAEAFIAQHCPTGAWSQEQAPMAYGSYDEALKDPVVEAIYVGTPNTAHFTDAKAALEAGKHVLLEKPATLNRKEFAVLVEVAKANSVFLMEGLWTQCFPIFKAIKEVLHVERAIGAIRSVSIDFSLMMAGLPDSHRVKNPALAGGVLLDLMPYPLLWAYSLLLAHPDNDGAEPDVQGNLWMGKTGVDEAATIVLDFKKLGARAVLQSQMWVASLEHPIRVCGDKGTLLVSWGTNRPTSFVCQLHPDPSTVMGPGMRPIASERKVDFPIPGWGMHWEADEVAECIRAGKTESALVPHAQTLWAMGVLDTVRQQGGYAFPEGLEKA